MAHGTPDWGLVGPKSTTYGLDDLGEAVVRLGSPHLWDRRGDVIVLESFENGLGVCQPLLSGALAALDLHAGNAAHGVLSLGLTAGSDVGHYAEVWLYHGLPVSSRVGLEFAFTNDQWTESWVWWIAWYTGTHLIQARVWFLRQTKDLQYEDDGGLPQPFEDDVQVWATAKCWNIGKLVVDFTEHRYIRFIMNDVAWDLSAYPMAFGLDPTPASLRVFVQHIGVADHNPLAYLDTVILTHNEP